MTTDFFKDMLLRKKNVVEIIYRISESVYFYCFVIAFDNTEISEKEHSNHIKK